MCGIANNAISSPFLNIAASHKAFAVVTADIRPRGEALLL